eukprot:1164419-Amphidinium_carterae.2
MGTAPSTSPVRAMSAVGISILFGRWLGSTLTSMPQRPIMSCAAERSRLRFHRRAQQEAAVRVVFK